jgi:hypothetical protein
VLTPLEWINSLSSIVLFPLVLYSGILLGQGKIRRAIYCYLAYIILVVIDTIIYWLAMENLG